jgi:hypothetical protein
MEHELSRLKNYACFPHSIFMFCMDIRTNGTLCSIQHHLIGSYNREADCLLPGTTLVFKYNRLGFVRQGLNKVCHPLQDA